MLTVNHTTRSYSGKAGCMCGCLGNYNESERVRKSAITALLKDPRTHLDAWGDGGCLHITTDTRIRALYLTPEGVEVVRAMGTIPVEQL